MVVVVERRIVGKAPGDDGGGVGAEVGDGA